MDNEHVRIGSIGPCLNKCDDRNWAGMGDDSFQVRLYKDEDYKSNGTGKFLTL